jgi:hypothetical protein
MEQVNEFAEWCSSNFLTLNVKKTKEMIIDFGRKATTFEDIKINGSVVERVDNYKYLGTVINNKLCWQENTNLICTKARKRIYFLRTLRRFNVDPTLLRLFYNSVVLSVITFNVSSWFENLPKHMSMKLERIDKTASRVIKDGKSTSLVAIAQKRTLDISRKILSNVNHPLREHFCLLRSGVRLRSLKTKTNRMGNSFIAQAIRLINELPPEERLKFTSLL